jgi:hypothetical protein
MYRPFVVAVEAHEHLSPPPVLLRTVASALSSKLAGSLPLVRGVVDVDYGKECWWIVREWTFGGKNNVKTGGVLTMNECEKLLQICPDNRTRWFGRNSTQNILVLSDVGCHHVTTVAESGEIVYQSNNVSRQRKFLGNSLLENRVWEGFTTKLLPEAGRTFILNLEPCTFEKDANPESSYRAR